MEVRILRVKDLEVPIPVLSREEDVRLAELRQRFDKGEKLGPEELRELVSLTGSRAANDNCWGC